MENVKNYEEAVDFMMLNEVCKDDVNLKSKIINFDRSKKRLAILNIMANSGKEIELFAKIAEVIKKDKISKAQHIKLIVQELRKYVGVSECAVKQHGEVMTPLELVEEMLDTLPQEVWVNPNLKWFDPADGVGIFPCIVVERLMEGLIEFEPDEDLRYKHIMENMIYVCELQTKNMFIFQCGFDPYDEIELNIHNGSFIEQGFNDMMKIWGVEKFDIIMGNPPYQENNDNNETKHGSGKLYPKFIIKSIDILKKDGLLLFVNPNTWFSGSDDSLTGKLFNIFKQFNLLVLNTESNNERISKKYFPKVGTGELSVFLLQKNTKYINTICNGNLIIDYSNNQFLPNILNNITMSIIQKVLFNDLEKLDFVKDSNSYHNSKTTRNDNELIIKDKKDSYFPIVNTITKKEGIKLLYCPFENFFQKDIKILISQSASFNNAIIDDGKYGFTQNITALLCNSIEDANIKLKLINSKLFQFIIEITKYGPAISPRMLKLLPNLDLNNIYKTLNLTQEEIDLVELTIK